MVAIKNIVFTTITLCCVSSSWQIVTASSSSSSSLSNNDVVVDMQILMYETEVDVETTANFLVGQANSFPSVKASIIGQGEQFEGFGSKYQTVIPVLRSMHPDTLVVLSDARDVLINNHISDIFATGSQALKEFKEGFDSLTKEYPGAIVVSAEAQCCVGALTYVKPGDYFDTHGRRKERACYSGHSPCLWNGDDKAVPWENFMKDLALERMGIGEDIYLNAGLMAGRADDMLRVFETADIQVTEDDQAVLTDYMFRRPNEIILDYDQVIFGNNRHSTKGCMFQGTAYGNRLVHTETKSSPLFIHSPGGFVSCHENLATQLGISSGVGSNTKARRALQQWKKGKGNYKPKKLPKCTWFYISLNIPCKGKPKK